MIKADYHVHSQYSIDSDEPMSESVEYAIKNGFTEIMFTDHYEVFKKGSSLQRVIDYDQYRDDLEALNKKYKGIIQMGLGAEINLEADMEQEYNQIIKKYDFDFIIGSLHNVDYIDVSKKAYYENLSMDDYHSKYFSHLLKAVKSDFAYSVLGHMDLITRYGPFVDNKVDIQRQMQWIEPILKTIIHKGKGLEINTSGMRYGLMDFHPSQEILIKYKELGGEIITVGSDSHVASTIGQNFDLAEKLLKDLGYKYYTVFSKMQPRFVNIL